MGKIGETRLRKVQAGLCFCQNPNSIGFLSFFPNFENRKTFKKMFFETVRFCRSEAGGLFPFPGN
jgi:hypothetical protein